MHQDEVAIDAVVDKCVSYDGKTFCTWGYLRKADGRYLIEAQDPFTGTRLDDVPIDPSRVLCL